MTPLGPAPVVRRRAIGLVVILAGAVLVLLSALLVIGLVVAGAVIAR